MRKLIVISELFYPSESATSVYMSEIAFEMSGYFNVVAISANPENKLLRNENFNDINIKRVHGLKFSRSGLLFRISRGVFFSFSLLLKAAHEIDKGSIVFVVTNPPLIPGFIALICKLKKAKCIIRVDDVYPDALVAAGVIDIRNSALPFLKILFRAAYKYSNKIIVLGRDMAHVISRDLNDPKGKVQIIGNWGEIDTVYPVDKSSNLLINQLGLQDSFVVLVAGTLGYVQGVDTIIEAAKILINKKPDIKFLFIGAGAQEGWVRSQVKEFSLTNISLLGLRPKSDQNIFLNACDVSLLALKRGMYGLGVPSRFYNYLSAGKPVIASLDIGSEVALTIRENNIGWVAEAGNVEHLIDVICMARNTSKNDLIKMSISARSFVEKYHSKKTIIKEYFNLFNNI